MELTQVFGIAAPDAIGGKHFRAARTLLGWTKRDAPENCGVGVNTIGRIESDGLGVGVRKIADIIRTFGEHGIVFVKCEDGSGVVLKSGDR